jgi:peptidoglycan/LPS O-acetylase OafA/YrhL
MSAARVQWVVAVGAIVAFVATGLIDPSGDVVATVFYAIGIGSFTLVGALLRTRVRANPIGRLLLAAGSLMATAMILVRVGSFGAHEVPPPPWAGAAVLAGSTLFVYPSRSRSSGCRSSSRTAACSRADSAGSPGSRWSG